MRRLVKAAFNTTITNGHVKTARWTIGMNIHRANVYKLNVVEVASHREKLGIVTPRRG